MTLPRDLERLAFGADFNQDLHVVFPSGLRTLTFGTCFSDWGEGAFLVDTFPFLKSALVAFLGGRAPLLKSTEIDGGRSPGKGETLEIETTGLRSSSGTPKPKAGSRWGIKRKGIPKKRTTLDGAFLVDTFSFRVPQFFQSTRSPSSALSDPFFGWKGSINYTTKGTLIPTSLLEDLV